MTALAAPDGRHRVDGVDLAARLNWLRAGVLGANDGIVSVAAIVIGVAAATSGPGATAAIATAGAAGLMAGALSMAVGEYVSVSTQRDSERAERRRGGTGDGHLTNPWHAAAASFVAFVVGGTLPMVAVLAAPTPARLWLTSLAVLAALVLTGAVSATLGRSPRWPAVLRNAVGGSLAMAITYGVGTLVGLAL